MINKNSTGFRVKGHVGKWYVIDTKEYDGHEVYLLEHETYGDEAACLIVDQDGQILLDDVWNGFEDYDYFLETA